MHKNILLACLMLLPLPALAAPKCEHSKPVSMPLELSGVNKVVFEVNAYDLTLTTANGTQGALGGRACASTADLLSQLEVRQERKGDTLHVELRRNTPSISVNLGKFYTGLYVTGTVPASMPVQLKVGSGDASVSGLQQLIADIGSGDVIARNIGQSATLSVGSGDATLEGAGAVHVVSVGSGDVVARNIRGDVKVGTVGSGDVEAHSIGGSASLDNVGSGDVTFVDVAGNVTVGVIGSGEVTANGVGGNLTVERVGSGDIHSSRVRGAVNVPRKR